MRNEFLSELRIGCAYRDIMKAIVNKNALLIAFRFCPCNFLKCCLQVIWSPQLEVPKNFMQLGVWDKTLRARVSGSSSTTSTKISCLLSILWLDQDARIEDAADTICATVGITTMRVVSQWSKYNLQNLLVDVSRLKCVNSSVSADDRLEGSEGSITCIMCLVLECLVSYETSYKTHHRHISTSIPRWVSNSTW